MLYRYRAATATGQLVEGNVSADSERLAIEELRRQTLVPVSVRSADESATPPRRVIQLTSKADDIAAAFRSLAALVGGGASLDRALDFTATHATHTSVRAALGKVRGDVQNGQSLATALKAQHELFGAIAPALVRAGEESGALADALARTADQLDRARALRTQLRDALLYPLLLGTVASMGILVLLLYVVPRFVTMLQGTGGALPRSTRLLVALSHALTGYWWAWVGLIVLAALGASAWLRRPENRDRWHATRLNVPVSGALERSTWTARFTRALGSMLASGAPLLSSLRIARDGVGNTALGAQLDRAIARVERGERLASSLDSVLPPLATQLLGIGEESGSLDAMSLRVADTYEDEVHRRLKTLVALVEPALIVLFGGLVGFVALAMLQAIYSINASVL